MKPHLHILIKACILLMLHSALHGQYRQNFGLVRHQPDSTLPKGKAPYDTPVRIPKSNAKANLIPVANGEYLLHQGWEMTDGLTALKNGNILSDSLDTRQWYDATVPGTVLTTLVDQGVYPDPYIGLNNMSIPDTLCRQDWWYRIAFRAPEAAGQKKVWLHFDGINYKAIFFLNGHLLGQIQGAFQRSVFDITQFLRSENNVLLVHILPPPNPGIPHEQSLLSGMGPNGGQLALDGPTFISSEGWDWVPGIRDRNIGIWQAVRLQYTGAVTITDPQVITNLPLPDTTEADITIRTTLKNHSSEIQQTRLRAQIDEIIVEQDLRLAPGEAREVIFSSKDFPALAMKSPRLWWPNGYGPQHLYYLLLTVLNGHQSVSDEQKIRFGIREFSYELMADAPHRKAWRILYQPSDVKGKIPPFDHVKRREFEKRIFIPSIRDGFDTTSFKTLSDGKNPFLVIRVNGKRVFCRGGNWGMDDGMKRVSRDRLEPYFKLHKHANYNMIRNWTGESTESTFFDLADEYGMLVWNDFWISTEGYNLNPLDQHLFLRNSLDAIRRFRNHASIAIWCPRNEGYAPDGIEDELYKQVINEDGTRHYIGNSREINLRQSGDWHYIEDPSLYFTKYAEGFSTEIGTFSVPLASTIRTFIKPEDQWPISDVWHYHDLHSNNQNLPGYLKAIDSLYGKPSGLDDFSRKAQLINYESHRAIFEGWNHKMWDRASGVLLWMTHPAWPSMIWQTYSSDGQTHGSYYGAKKACEPVHVQLNKHDNSIVLINTSLSALPGISLMYSIHSLEGKKVFSHQYKNLVLPANDKQVLESPSLGMVSVPENYMVRIELVDANGSSLSRNEYWKTKTSNGTFQRFNDLPNQALRIEKTALNQNNINIKVYNKGKSPVVGIRLGLLDGVDKPILPAFFSDGYFSLMPGESRIIELIIDKLPSDFRILTEAYNSPAAVHAW